VDPVAVGEGTHTAFGPPATPERRRRHDADTRNAVLLERDQGRPDGDAAGVVACAVDRIENPAPASTAAHPELLAEHAVAGTLHREPCADRLLDGSVGLRHRGAIRFRLDDQVVCAKAADGESVGRVCKFERQRQVGAQLPAVGQRALGLLQLARLGIGDRRSKEAVAEFRGSRHAELDVLDRLALEIGQDVVNGARPLLFPAQQKALRLSQLAED
jgi:hypothetical protein